MAFHVNKERKKARLKRQEDVDSVPREFYDCPLDSGDKCPHLRIWRPVPGTEDEKLPFGQRCFAK